MKFEDKIRGKKFDDALELVQLLFELIDSPEMLTEIASDRDCAATALYGALSSFDEDPEDYLTERQFNLLWKE